MKICFETMGVSAVSVRSLKQFKIHNGGLQTFTLCCISIYFFV